MPPPKQPFMGFGSTFNGGSKKPTLKPAEKLVYDVIKGKGDMGMWLADIKTETKIPQPIVTKAIKNLTQYNLIKDVVHVRLKGRKMYMASEFEPAAEVSGGAWYSDGALDSEFVETLMKTIFNYIGRSNYATVDMIKEYVKNTGIFKMDFTTKQIIDILYSMILEKQIEKSRSNGDVEFGSIQIGKECYRLLNKQETLVGNGFTSVPCGVCPSLKDCSPNGKISPATCVYFDKWLSF
ncbi:putative DNA-directed RNA polymerase III subunit F [Zostera marina]|uniref:Putative DNA-directed RNA polymerase III subunit F n=1 Tax=Zostera marina TaxID=29655 RepID=A0A0K9NYQ5_ZOSMR|nr:putative DNA-directed RNA polymerase III subunit F [Zostera marina]